MDFCDFHPENALGFLPHELDAVHLRMLWRRWKKKARLTVFGQPVTPVGLPWLDKALSAILGLKGDCVADFRLVDYLVTLLSTSESPALDGTIGNDGRLKHDLAQLGIFNDRMSLYLLYKLRAYHVIGFSGFEGRHYSVFESFGSDMAEGATLQALVTALAYKYIAAGTVRHSDIPNDPETESERRQFIFGTAIGISTCNVRQDGPHAFLHSILSRTEKTRGSRRYPGHLRVRLMDYQCALLRTIEEDGHELIEMFGVRDTINRLKDRVLNPGHEAVSGKLINGILREAGARSPLHLPGEEFNVAAERYYRETLRRRHLSEALDMLEEDLRRIDDGHSSRIEQTREAVTAVIGRRSGAEFLRAVRQELVEESADDTTLRRCIHLALLAISVDASEAHETLKESQLCST